MRTSVVSNGATAVRCGHFVCLQVLSGRVTGDWLVLMLCLLVLVCCAAQICSCSMVLAVGSYPVARFWFFRNWKKANQSQQFEQKVLR
jgi:hypothetical protein